MLSSTTITDLYALDCNRHLQEILVSFGSRLYIEIEHDVEETGHCICESEGDVHNIDILSKTCLGISQPASSCQKRHAK